MNCDDFRKSIDLKFTGGRYELSTEAESHRKSCESCGLYLRDLLGLNAVLKKQEFEILPGELDDITFENIAGMEKPLRWKRALSESISIGLKRWAWAPIAAVAVALALNLIPRDTEMQVDDELSAPQEVYMTWDEIYSTIEESDVWTDVVGSLVESEADLEMASEELMSDMDFDVILEDLTEEELDLLYNKIDQINGSAS
jgi:hypothetical protein